MCVLQANLLSSHRSLVHRVETIALGDKPCDRGEHVTLFLFSDCLEACSHLHSLGNFASVKLLYNLRNEITFSPDKENLGSLLQAIIYTLTICPSLFICASWLCAFLGSILMEILFHDLLTSRLLFNFRPADFFFAFSFRMTFTRYLFKFFDLFSSALLSQFLLFLLL